MRINERDSRHEHVLAVGRQMMTAARTAPKARGFDVVEVMMVMDDDIQTLSDKLRSMADDSSRQFFNRDADCILNAECVILIGTHVKAQALDCGYCGYAKCKDRPKTLPCAINTIDVGIAIGSACATAADNRVDTRVMFSAGYAALQLDWLEGCTQVFAIPVSASSKNPFFDRKSK